MCVSCRSAEFLNEELHAWVCVLWFLNGFRLLRVAQRWAFWPITVMSVESVGQSEAFTLGLSESAECHQHSQFFFSPPDFHMLGIPLIIIKIKGGDYVNKRFVVQRVVRFIYLTYNRSFRATELFSLNCKWIIYRKWLFLFVTLLVFISRSSAKVLIVHLLK